MAQFSLHTSRLVALVFWILRDPWDFQCSVLPADGSKGNCVANRWDVSVADSFAHSAYCILASLCLEKMP
jgi:hypothetical protein